MSGDLLLSVCFMWASAWTTWSCAWRGRASGCKPLRKEALASPPRLCSPAAPSPDTRARRTSCTSGRNCGACMSRLWLRVPSTAAPSRREGSSTLGATKPAPMVRTGTSWATGSAQASGPGGTSSGACRRTWRGFRHPGSSSVKVSAPWLRSNARATPRRPSSWMAASSPGAIATATPWATSTRHATGRAGSGPSAGTAWRTAPWPTRTPPSPRRRAGSSCGAATTGMGASRRAGIPRAPRRCIGKAFLHVTSAAPLLWGIAMAFWCSTSSREDVCESRMSWFFRVAALWRIE
mmetsp:Transcript_158333/g.507801  ORF Transcript_158333/g.507801 Transcript_158333/m.507801 type:complete len:293 (+) Transcript_158333:4062-4940(+)